MTEGLSDTLERAGSPRILVLGDLILDRYVWGEAQRISPEGPIAVLNQTAAESRPGGAGNVAAALQQLGAKVGCAGVVGDDAPGRELTAAIGPCCSEETAVIVDTSRPTTVKTRFIGHVQSARRASQHMLRVDAESRNAIAPGIEEQIIAFLRSAEPDFDAVVLSDYDKGLLTEAVLAEAIRIARDNHVPVIADPRLGRDYAVYSGVTTITPNRYEAQTATGIVIRDRDSMDAAARKLVSDFGFGSALITLDRDGMFLCTENDEGTQIRTEPREVYDVTGAGDVVVSVIGLMVGAGAELRQAAEIANVAAGIEVGKVGAAPVSREEILAELRGRRHSLPLKLKTETQLLEALQEHRRRNESVVFTNGCFDLLHVGHIKYLQFARRQGDLLVVAMNSDDSIRRQKGPSRPILGQEDRAQILAALEDVGYIVIFDAPTPQELIERVRPEVLVKGEDWREKGVVGREFVESIGGRVVLAPLVDGISTTDIVRRIIERYGNNDAGP